MRLGHSVDKHDYNKRGGLGPSYKCQTCQQTSGEEGSSDMVVIFCLAHAQWTELQTSNVLDSDNEYTELLWFL